MPNIVSLSVKARNAQADALARQLDDGDVKLYSGTPPADVTQPLSGNTLAGTCEFSAVSAPAAVNGTLTFDAIADDVSADAEVTLTFYRTYEADGVTAVTQGSIGATGSGESLTVPSTSVKVGDPIKISSFTHTV